MISIHAPTRGATVGLTEFDVAMLISIHAPTRGATLLHTQHQLSEIFQSTLPQGERRFEPYRVRLGIYFNPRSHKGSDEKAQKLIQKLIISIHAPTRGATVGASLPARHLSQFQSTLPQGERPATRRHS